MKIIIDPYRGGTNTGKKINDQYEKNIILNISKQLSEKLQKLGIASELVRTNDITLSDEERNSIINELKDLNDIIIQIRISEDKDFDIIYPLRSSDNLSSVIANDIESKDINVDKYYQRRLPANTTLDYYSVIRNTSPNETIIIEYPEESDYNEITDIIANSLSKYVKKKNIYIVQKGDSLYQIAKKYNTTVDELKKLNNLTNNNLSLGQILKIPEKKENNSNGMLDKSEKKYIVKKGDSLYQIAKQNNTTVETLKTINNLINNTISIGQILILPSDEDLKNNEYNNYVVQKGDSLYQIAKKYNTTVDELKKLNNLTSNNLNIGQILKIPNSNQIYTTYKVIKGDTLYQIAKKYNITVDKLKKLNNLTNNTLTIGQILKISQ